MTEEVKNAIQDYYADDFAWCYGCGRNNKNGHHFRTAWQGDNTLSIYTPSEEQIAVPGFVYGGVIASFLDCHSAGSCALALHRKNGHEPGDGATPPRFVAASLKVNFLKPTPQGVPLKAIGTVSEVHPKRFNVVSEMYAGDTLCASSEFEGVVMPEVFVKASDSKAI